VKENVWLDVLMAVNIKLAVFWVVARLMMEAVQASGTLVNSYQSTRRYNPEDSHLRRNCYLLNTVFRNVPFKCFSQCKKLLFVNT
jgi:hypothetical protein